MQCLARNAAVGSKRRFVNQAVVNSLTINTHAVDLTQQSSITLGYVRYASRKHIELHIIDPAEIMPKPVKIVKEWFGSPLPPNSPPLPTPAELLHFGNERHPLGYTLGKRYPSNADNSPFWIKFGNPWRWNEPLAQKMAHEGLLAIQSLARAPAVYYACQIVLPSREEPDDLSSEIRLYTVMEFVPGKTAEQVLQALDDEATKDRVYKQIAFALSEMHRIPVPDGARPASVNGDRIRNSVFCDNEAGLHYRNVQHMEDHFNLIIKLAKKQHPAKDLVREPMVFCYSDVWLKNFFLDDQGNITVIDFEDASIVPSSFARFVAANAREKIRRDIKDLVVVPQTDGIDNVATLHAIQGPSVIGGGSLSAVGRKLFGRYEPELEDFTVDKIMVDEEGNPVEAYCEDVTVLEDESGYPEIFGWRETSANQLYG